VTRLKILLVSPSKEELKHLKEAFKDKGMVADAVELSSISLLSKRGGTVIKGLKSKLDKYDGVYLHSKLKLTPFVEPLLEEFENRGIYCQVGVESHYICNNQALQLAYLTAGKCNLPKTMVFGNTEDIEGRADEFSYPVIFKAFVEEEKTLSVIVESQRSLKSVASGIYGEVDMAIVREFIEAPLDVAIVMGDKVFNVRRELVASELEPLKNAKPLKLSKLEHEAAIHAASVCKCDVALVKISNAHVLRVTPEFSLKSFSKLLGQDLYEELASFFKIKLGGRGK
jgi:hypothetical protein